MPEKRESTTQLQQQEGKEKDSGKGWDNMGALFHDEADMAFQTEYNGIAHALEIKL